MELEVGMVVEGKELESEGKRKVCPKCEGERFFLLTPPLEQSRWSDWQVVCAECGELIAMAIDKDYFI